MKKYMLLLIGAGEGCDHTIGCNRKWVELEWCTSIEDAVAMAKIMLIPTGDPGHETSEDLDRIASGRVLEISDSRLLDIDTWQNNMRKSKYEKEKRVASENDMKLIATLKEKYPDEFRGLGVLKP